MSPQERTAWLFTAPVLAVIALVFVLPTLLALVLSVTDYSIYALADWRNLDFVGLGNFVDLARTPLFWRALANTALFAVIGVPMAIGASLSAALLLNDATVRWKPAWRVLLFAPYVTNVVATAIVWRYLLNTRFGLVNWALSFVGLGPVDWLGNPHASIPAILLFVTWKIFGYNMIVFTAALAAVPHELMEAARLDGASLWGRFRHVTLPAIGPTLLLAAIMSVAGFLQLFAEPYVMTLGGPAQSTVTVLYFMFDEGFKWWNLGQAERGRVRPVPDDPRGHLWCRCGSAAATSGCEAARDPRQRCGGDAGRWRRWRRWRGWSRSRSCRAAKSSRFPPPFWPSRWSHGRIITSCSCGG